MIEPIIKNECDICGWEHGTSGENRAFRWCRRYRGTVCSICCKECQYNEDWNCKFDLVGKMRMYELTYANMADERRISKLEKRAKIATSPLLREAMLNTADKIRAKIEVREKEHEKIYSGEIVMAIGSRENEN